MLIGAGGTLLVGMGVYAACRWTGVSARYGFLASMAATLGWLALAGPAMAAGARTLAGAALRAGAMVDASVVLLLVAGIGAAGLSVSEAGAVYVVLASLTLVNLAAVRVPRSRAGRSAVASLLPVLWLILLSTPLWVGGALQHGDGSRGLLATWAVRMNPFYGVCLATLESVGFVWSEANYMYSMTRIGDYASPGRVGWYEPAALCGAVAIVLAGVSLVRGHRIRRGERSEANPGT